MSQVPFVDTQLRSIAITHMVAAVSAAPIQEDPFPHILVTGFFPTQTYDRLLECLPSPASYEAFDYEKHANENGQSNRKRFRLENACLDTLPQAQRTFWYTIRSALGSLALKEAVYRKLRSGLSYRFNCDPDATASLPGFALPELFHETTGYRIKPHPDTRRKVVTMQIALPQTDAQKDLGTEFYRRSIRPAAWLRDPKGFEIVKTMPFIPNTAYAFSVLNTLRLKSWHGRSSLSSQCGVRNSILNIWYQNAEDANTEIQAENEHFAKLGKAA
jgi:hypothetical protein